MVTAGGRHERNRFPTGRLAMIAATGLLGGRAHFVHWGVVQLSLANLLVIAIMVVLLVLALVVPFPHGRDADENAESPR